MGSPLQKPQREFPNDLIPVEGSSSQALVRKHVISVQVHTETCVPRHMYTHMHGYTCMHTHRRARNSFIYIRSFYILLMQTGSFTLKPVHQKPTCGHTHSFTCAHHHTHTNMYN